MDLALGEAEGGGGFGMTPWCDDLVCSRRRLLADRHSLPFPQEGGGGGGAEFSLRGGLRFRRGGGCAPPPPSGDPELLEAPKAPNKRFGLN